SIAGRRCPPRATNASPASLLRSPRRQGRSIHQEATTRPPPAGKGQDRLHDDLHASPFRLPRTSLDTSLIHALHTAASFQPFAASFLSTANTKEENRGRCFSRSAHGSSGATRCRSASAETASSKHRRAYSYSSYASHNTRSKSASSR